MLNIIKYNTFLIFFLFLILHVSNKVYGIERIGSEGEKNIEDEGENIDNESIKKEEKNEENNEDINSFHSFFHKFNNGIPFSPFSLFNISPFDIPFDYSLMNNIFNNENNIFKDNIEFNVTHPKGDVCKFLIEWQKGMKVENISVDVDVKNRLIMLKYSHKQETNETETTETAYLEEYIDPSCLLTDEVVNEQKAAFAVKDQEGAAAVQIWFPNDPNYVKSPEDGSASTDRVRQYRKSKSCVKNIRNGRCNEVATKTISTSSARIHTRLFSSHAIPEEEKGKENNENGPSKIDEEKLSENATGGENEENRRNEEVNTYIEEYKKESVHTANNKKSMQRKHMSSEDENAHMYGIDVTSPILHLSQKNWRDEL